MAGRGRKKKLVRKEKEKKGEDIPNGDDGTVGQGWRHRRLHIHTRAGCAREGVDVEATATAQRGREGVNVEAWQHEETVRGRGRRGARAQ